MRALRRSHALIAAAGGVAIPAHLAIFSGSPGGVPGWRIAGLRFGDPVAVRQAHAVDGVRDVIRFVEEAAGAGLWAVLALSYEAAGAFGERLAVRADATGEDDFPLAFAAAYDGPLTPESRAGIRPGAGTYGLGSWSHSPWRPLVSRTAYGQAFARIREYLRQGETYQVNYTLPFVCDFSGDPLAWFEELAGVQAAGYACALDCGRHEALCFSPELFIERAGEVIASRPMKGTSAIGPTRRDDRVLAARLAACPKNRAENVMITDMLRNDLGRLAVPGSVRVPELFTVERYPTVLQMTSTVTARLYPGTGLWDVLRAVFPCASITGAPKVRTMEIIKELEPYPRGLYCGAIGYVRPGGDFEFCVPIRTVTLDAATGRARFGVGGGITYDSAEEGEYEECRVKMGFLSGGGDFELLETLLLDGGAYAMLPGHLARARESAAYYGFAWGGGEALRALDEARRGRERGRFRVRLLFSRRGEARTEVFPLNPLPPVMRVSLAETPVDGAQAFLRHKTTRREVYDQARAQRPDCDEVILQDRDGFVTEGCFSNVVVSIGGELYTPPDSRGLLPGVFREELLRRGLVLERDIRPEELVSAESLWLCNSVRGFMPARFIPGKA